MSGPMFRAYVEEILAPHLRPGDVVGLDNLPVHKVAGVGEAILSSAGGKPSADVRQRTCRSPKPGAPTPPPAAAWVDIKQ